MKGWLLIIIGVVLIGLCVYGLMRKPPVAAVAPTSTPESTPSRSWKSVGSGSVDVARQWTNIGKYQGHIRITVTGSAVLHNSGQPVTPAGWDIPADPGYVIPGAPVFSAVARIGGNTQRVGASAEFKLVGETEIWLGPNEDSSGTYGPGLKDNSGRWTYQVFVYE